jgi:carboxyl-terminal processing protease
MRRFATWRPPLWLVILLMVGTLALGFGVGNVRGAEDATGDCTESAEVCADFANFWEVWNVAEARFVDPDEIVPDDMIAGAINGMLDTLGDQGHTRYLTAEQVKRFAEDLQSSFEGIGAYVDMQGTVPVIVAPIEGSPAEAAGIKAGDLILEINGETTEGLLIDEVISRIRGPEGTEVTLTVQHAGEEGTEELTIKRASVTVPAVTWAMLPGDIAHVRLSQFAENAAAEMRAAITAAQNDGAKGIILDVRDNPGGLRDQAVQVTGMFVPKDSPVLIEVDRDGKQDVYRSEEENPFTEIPMVVLINGGSASSAEIFAGALQDYNRATVIGTPTAGTGTVLSNINIADGSAVLLGTKQWQTPKGRYLRREGVSPDITVGLEVDARALTPTLEKDMTEEEILNSQDEQVLRALDILGGGSDETAMAIPRFWPR